MDEERPLFILAGNAPTNRGCEAIGGDDKDPGEHFRDPRFLCSPISRARSSSGTVPRGS